MYVTNAPMKKKRHPLAKTKLKPSTTAFAQDLAAEATGVGPLLRHFKHPLMPVVALAYLPALVNGDMPPEHLRQDYAVFCKSVARDLTILEHGYSSTHDPFSGSHVFNFNQVAATSNSAIQVISTYTQFV
jgi:hypothetical protein